MKPVLNLIFQKIRGPKKKTAFTIIEILVTIVIIGILATITLFGYNSALMRSRDQQRLTDMHSIANALDRYYLDNKRYPVTISNPKDVLVASYQLDRNTRSGCSFDSIAVGTDVSNSLTPNYLGSIPQDPQNKLDLKNNNGACLANDQNGQYLYTSIVSANSDVPHDYMLIAKMERTNNMSSTTPSSSAIGFYYSDLLKAVNICSSASSQQNCGANYFLGPKNGQ